MEDHREVCLEEEVDRLKRSGMSVQEISDLMGLDPNWVVTVVEMVPDEEEPVPEERDRLGTHRTRATRAHPA